MKQILTFILFWMLKSLDSAATAETKSDALFGAYIYDPITGKSSLANVPAKDLSFRSIQTRLKNDDSFTIEVFAKPDADLQTRPRDFLPVFKSAGDENFLIAGIRRSTAPHSYNWWQSRITKKSERPIDLARNRYRGISMVTKETPWRHLAFSWDAEAKTARHYLDYQLQASTQLEAEPEWDVSTVEIGGGGISKSFAGLIDEVRVTAKALPPWHFLRQSKVSLTDVSFAPDSKPTLPADYGHADVQLHYGAVGDGKHDDTEAIRRAFAENENRVPNEYRTVHFPAGTYLISDTIRFSRFMVVRGAGKDETVIRLKDDAAGFATPDVPKPAFAVGYDWPYVDRPKKNRAGNVIGNYIFNLAIETGKGNPSALGLDFHCNNVGCVENVDITSGDGSGMVGLDLKRGWPGPCLMKNVSITGFDIGIAAAHREYSIVFSGIQLQGQRTAGITNGGNVLTLENVVSKNTVPAVQNRGGGLVVLINSQLRGGAPKNAAIKSENASIYLRNIDVGGYSASLLETRKPKNEQATTLSRLTDKHVGEHFTGPLDHAFEANGSGSLKLPIKQTPDISFPAISKWTNVRDFEHLVVEGDWAPAIQAAVDSGRELVYFPEGANYSISKDVILRGTVRTLLGGWPKASVGSGEDDPKEGAAFVLDAELPIVQFHMLGSAHIKHHSPTKLLLRHCNTGHITAGPKCGELFIEDAGGKFRFSEYQRIWARQLNPETKGIPEIINNGGQLWVLGLKTEYLSTKIENRGGARTEILGGLMYPVHPVTDESIPMFLNENSDISLVHGVSVYKKNHKIYMKDTHGGETREHRDWRWVSGRPISNLYRSVRPSSRSVTDLLE